MSERPLTAEELIEIRERAERNSNMCNHARADVPRLLAEIERIHSWGGLMSLLDEHWPADIFPMPEGLDGAKGTTHRDTGPIVLGLIRWVDKLNGQRADALAKLDAVREWHSKDSRHCYADGDPWPCRTVRILDGGAS